MSIVTLGLAGLGFLSLAFLIHEIRTAPYCDYPDADKILSEIDKQMSELRQAG